MNFRDIISRNIGDIKSFKSGKLQSGKEQIEHVHADLKRRKNMKEDMISLHAL